MTVAAEKHNSVIDESVNRILARANDARGLSADNLRPRVEKALDKYLFRDKPDASSQEIRSFAEELRADDLCLVLACEMNDERAWSDLVSTQDATVRSAARKIASSPEDADDLASSIWAELYGLKHDKDGKLKSKLSYYSGRGSLGGWLRAIVSQLAIDEFRKQSRLVQVEEDREFENLANESSARSDSSSVLAQQSNPESIFGEKEMSRDVSRALKQAIEELSADDRLLLKLYYFDDIKLKDLGQMFGYHEATASRKLMRIQTEIRKSVERILSSEHNWSESEVARCLTETASKLGISLEKMISILIVFVFVQEALGGTVL